MSDVFYPTALVASCKVQNNQRVISDEFEAGNTSTRRSWPAQNVKRRLEIQHAPLTPVEYSWLKGFHAKRDAGYDYFWFRDNVNRGGNVKARFAGPLESAKASQVFDVTVALDEVAPIRANPELTDIYEAISVVPALLTPPVLWWDANREIYFEHLGVAYSTDVYDASGSGNNAAWQGGTSLTLTGIYGQWQDYFLNGSRWAKTPTDFAISGTQPACTIFLITKAASSATQQVLFEIGTKGTGQTLGIQLTAANNFAPFIGGSEAWATAISANSAASTWRSVAVKWGAGSNSASLLVNAAVIGSESITRSYVAGPAVLGAASDGTLKASADVAHILVFNSSLSTTQIKSLHNLFAYQLGMATVP